MASLIRKPAWHDADTWCQVVCRARQHPGGLVESKVHLRSFGWVDRVAYDDGKGRVVSPSTGMHGPLLSGLVGQQPAPQ